MTSTSRWRARTASAVPSREPLSTTTTAGRSGRAARRARVDSNRSRRSRLTMTTGTAEAPMPWATRCAPIADPALAAVPNSIPPRGREAGRSRRWPSSERGERLVELAGGGRALVEGDEPEGLVGRVVGVVLEAEAGHHRGDVAGGELGHDRDRAAAAHERRRSAHGPLQGLRRQRDGGIVGREERRLTGLGRQLELRPGRERLAQQALERGEGVPG